MKQPIVNRRTFLGTSGGASLALALPGLGRRPPAGTVVSGPDPVFTLWDPQVKTLAHTALEAATQGGASYADVRMTYWTRRHFAGPSLQVQLGLSVRALFNGYWGWAGTPYLAASEAVRIGREAAVLAKGMAGQGKPRHVELGTIPVVSSGTWRTPIKTDPFDVPIEEISDWFKGNAEYFEDLTEFRFGERKFPKHQNLDFAKREQVFASTEGSYQTQTVHTIAYNLDTGEYGEIDLPLVQGGWEYVWDAKIRERIRALVEAPPAAPLPVKTSLDIGRYDIVFDAKAMACILEATLAPAMQLDRELGYEANAGGTSYLGPDPLTFLGTAIAAAPVTVTADRSHPQGLATIGWDDEGVAPEDFPLVKDGVMVDCQTTREEAAWLAPWYKRQGKPIRSHGCAASESALTCPLQHTPNLTLQPGPTAQDVTELCAALDHGLLVTGVAIREMDFQAASGIAYVGGHSGGLLQVRRGKAVATIAPPRGAQGNGARAVVLRAQEFWKGVLAVGGPASLKRNFLGVSAKGEPTQEQFYSLAAVPALVKQLAVIEPDRAI